MANKVGPLIKEARTKAGLSQESLARKVDGLSASDLGKAERGEKELTQSVLKLIAKATGVTQSSLIEAAKASTYSTGTKKTATAAKKTTAAAKKTTTAAKKTTTASTAKKSSAKSMELTAAEKKLVELYRAADTDTRKNAVAVLKGEASVGSDLLNSLLGGAMDLLSKK